jgi:hypothetical protein
MPARPGRQRLVSGFCSSAHRFATRFFQPSPHGRGLAVHLGRYDQLPGGLSPPSHRPCWAHIGIGGSRGTRLSPSHTTGHAGPHPAVREVEVAPPRYRRGRLSARVHACSSGFTAALYPRGFTPTLQREPRSCGHLVPGLPTFCGRAALPLVRPFIGRVWVQAHECSRPDYYDLC